MSCTQGILAISTFASPQVHLLGAAQSSESAHHTRSTYRLAWQLHGYHLLCCITMDRHSDSRCLHLLAPQGMDRNRLSRLTHRRPHCDVSSGIYSSQGDSPLSN